MPKYVEVVLSTPEEILNRPPRSDRLSRDLYTFFRSSTSYRLRIALS